MGEGLRDVTEVLMQDHREVERMFGELESMLAMDGARGGSQSPSRRRHS